MGTVVSDVIAGGNECAVQQGHSIQSDIYYSSNHFTGRRKEFGKRGKMMLDGSEFTKDDREIQLYNEFEHFRQTKSGEKNHSRILPSSNARNKAMVQDGKVVVQDVRGRYNATNQGRPFCQSKTMQGKIIHMAPNIMSYHEVHGDADRCTTQLVVRLDADYTSDSNIIPYDQYVEDNEEHVVQCNVSSVRNDALMSILDEMHEQGVQSRLANKPDMVVNDSVTSELARYKELVGEYEKRAKFELTDREQKIDEQMRIIISDRNRKETSLKSELHSAQILLSSTVDHYKSKTEEVTLLKKDFKQKEDKFLEEFLDLKKLKDKIEDRLYKQDQSVQTVHMLCKPKSFYDEKHKIWKPKGKLSDNSLNKTKQIWKPKGKLSDYSLNKTKQVWKATGKLFANVGYQWRSTGKKVALGKLNCDSQWRPTGKKFALGELCPLTKLSVQCRTGPPLVSGLRLFKTYDGESFKAQELCQKVHRKGILALFVILRGTNILKVIVWHNLYTISIDEMMKSSPICLLSTVPRGLPRLKFGKRSLLCSACQLGKSKKFSQRPKSENTNMKASSYLHMDSVWFQWSKDETPEFVINFLKQMQVGLNKTVIFIRTDNGMEFVNQVMSDYYEGVGHIFTIGVFTPFKDPEQELRPSRKHFKTLSLDESRSPDFDLFSDQEEYSEEEVAEAMAKTMEQYMSKT
ncbi:hypothetical protein Tco_0366419 [Tanacetum coccineum]